MKAPPFEKDPQNDQPIPKRLPLYSSSHRFGLKSVHGFPPLQLDFSPPYTLAIPHPLTIQFFAPLPLAPFLFGLFRFLGEELDKGPLTPFSFSTTP